MATSNFFGRKRPKTSSNKPKPKFGKEIVTKPQATGAFTKARLTTLLKTNVIKFLYTKKDGEKRILWGTACRDILDTDAAADLYKFVKPTGQLPYDITKTNNIIVWDLEKDAWRTVNCLRAKVLVAIPADVFIQRMTRAELGGDLYFKLQDRLLYGKRVSSQPMDIDLDDIES